MTGDTAAEWFDYWIDTLAHDETKLYYSKWAHGPRTDRHLVGAVERGVHGRIHELGLWSNTIGDMHA